MSKTLYNIDAYILTGGQSSRLKSNKSLIKLADQTLTEILHKKLGTIFKNVYIVGKENQFPEFNFIQDNKHNKCPLIGIVTALEHSNNEWIFVIACDLPLIKTSSIKSLYKYINSKTQVIVPVIDNNLQPLCAFYHKNVLTDLNAAADRGDYSLMKLLIQFDVKKITIPLADKDYFINVNNSEDLIRAEEFIKIENNKLC